MSKTREELIEARLRDAIREGGGWPNDSRVERYVEQSTEQLLREFEQVFKQLTDEELVHIVRTDWNAFINGEGEQ